MVEISAQKMAKKIEMWDMGRLKPYEKNARTHSDSQVAQIAASISEFGFTNPILVDSADGIIAGHGRLMAAKSLGLAEVPVIVLDYLTDAQRRAYIIADNKLALNAGWDDALLAEELERLSAEGFDIGLTGFLAEEIEELFGAPDSEGFTDEDDAPPAPKDPVSKMGDTWILGPHRVTCGDSTVLADVERAMGGGAMADACWTDPPYNVNYESKLAGKIKNDSMAEERFRAFLLDAFVSGFAVMKPGAPIYVAHADTEGLNFRAAFREAGFKISGCLIWAKDSLVLGRSDYQWQHEPILYGWKTGAAHRWFGGRKKTTLLNAGGATFTKNADGTITVSIGSELLIISGENLQAQAVEPTILRCEKPKRSADHPTMKPVGLIQKMLENSTRQGDIVLDLFGGSGSTLIACETTGRQARLVELDPRFVDVIVRRWQDYTGKSATLDGGGTFSEHADKRLKK